MTRNLHFETVAGWQQARALLTFDLLEPSDTAGCALKKLEVHIRDHKMRDLAKAERSLEAHYGVFVLTQSWKGDAEARRAALDVSYGPNAREAQILGRDARVYELGPEPPPDDIDGRQPAVVAWHDGAMFYFIASVQLPAVELMRIAASLYRPPA
jgi:hypothetical protein